MKLVLILCSLGMLWGQNPPFTKPVTSYIGTVTPANCNNGDIFYNSLTYNWYSCGAGNIYVLILNTNNNPVNVLAYGADPTGVKDSADAFNLAIATSRNVYAPCGTYKILSSLTVLLNDSWIHGDGGCSVIWYKGNTTISDVFTMGQFGTENYRYHLSNIFIRGNSHVTGAALKLKYSDHGVFENVILKDATVCLSDDSGVINTFTNLECSGNTDNGFLFVPSIGIDIQSCNASVFIDPIIESILTAPGIGIRVGANGNRGTNTQSISFIGGTAETSILNISNGPTGGVINTNFINFDAEVPTGANTINDGGLNTIISGGIWDGVIHLTNIARETLITGAEFNSLLIDSGAVLVTYTNNTYDSSGTGSITDNGTRSIYFNNHDANPGLTPYQTQLPNFGSSGDLSKTTVSGTISFSSAPNFIANETGANNALVGTLTDFKGTNIPVVYPLCVTQVRLHTLQAGANTYNLNGSGAFPLLNAINGNNFSTSIGASGQPLQMCLNSTSNSWYAFVPFI